MCDALVQRVYDFLQREATLGSGDTLIVGVSGGPDSLCLLHALVAVRSDLGFALHVAHLDHMLRGVDSTADATFVVTFAQRLGVPATVERADVGAAAQMHGENLHHTARVLRYHFFARLAHEINASAVAVAHTADDQAETVLMHLLRGAGTAGLGAMQPISRIEHAELGIEKNDHIAGNRPQFSIRNSQLLRPLLTTIRAEVEAYCAAHDLRPRHDATNDDPRYTRNHIRHTLLPQIRMTHPRIVESLNRTAAICADDANFIAQALDAAWPTLAYIECGAVTFSDAAWRALHPALQRAALRRAYALIAPSETLPWGRVEAVRALIGQVGKRVELPGGVQVVTTYNGAKMYAPGHIAVPSGPQLAGEAHVIGIGESIVFQQGWELHTRFCNAPASQAHDLWESYLDADVLPEQLTVRRRRAGDRLKLAGGHRRLQDVFVDAKVPRELRAEWPLITTLDTIVWVPGVRVARDYAATPETEHVLHIWLAPPHVEKNDS